MEVILISEKINLIGLKFGKLTVVDNTVKIRKNRPAKLWLCKCDCGKEYIADTYSLKSGKCIQCHDCAHAEIGKKRRIDYTGEKFGKLTVLKMIYIPYGKRNKTACECLCDCGNIVNRSISSLLRSKNGAKCSCGCANDEINDRKSRDIVGDVFGRLTVLDEIKVPNNRKVKCLCDCGNEIIASKRDVISGHTRSCGCLQVDMASEKNKKDWTGYVSNYGIKIIEPSFQNEKANGCGNAYVFVGNHLTYCQLK